jgi:hypothetical protein
VNLTRLLQSGGRIVVAAIATSGTTVTFSRDPDLQTGVTVDKDTLTITDATPQTDVLVDELAVVQRTGTVEIPDGPGRTKAVPAYRILLRPSAAVLRRDDVGSITAALDPHLVGAKLTVTAAAPDPSGAFQNVEAIGQ